MVVLDQVLVLYVQAPTLHVKVSAVIEEDAPQLLLCQLSLFKLDPRCRMLLLQQLLHTQADNTESHTKGQTAHKETSSDLLSRGAATPGYPSHGNVHEIILSTTATLSEEHNSYK